MPEHVARLVQRPRVIGRNDVTVVVDVGDSIDRAAPSIGVAGQGHLNRAETFTERDMLLVGDFLVMKDEHRVFVEGIPQLRECVLIDRRGDVNSTDFSPNVLFQLVDRYG